MPEQAELLDLTAVIVSSYLENNSVRPGELPDLIASVHASLANLGSPERTEEPAPELKPAVPVKKSVTPDYIISLEDGRRFKSMKRYLAGLGMTPDDYRAKWGLPKDYPMVAPGYSARRSELALSAGLGRSQIANLAITALTDGEPKPTTPAPVVDGSVAEQQAPEQLALEKVAKKRGRPKKVLAAAA